MEKASRSVTRIATKYHSHINPAPLKPPLAVNAGPRLILNSSDPLPQLPTVQCFDCSRRAANVRKPAICQVSVYEDQLGRQRCSRHKDVLNAFVHSC